MPVSPFLNLKLQSDYYPDLKCPDFEITPTPACALAMKNHRLHFQADADGLRILITLDEEGKKPFIALPENLTLRFFLTLKNPLFSAFSDLTASYDGQQLSYPVFSNKDVNTSNDEIILLEASEAEAFHTGEFELKDGKKENGHLTFMLGQRPKKGSEKENFSHSGEHSLEIIDFRPETNSVLINAGDQQQGRFSLTYPVRAKLPWGRFGRIDLSIPDSLRLADFSQGNPERRFTIHFQTRALFWKYYIVSELALDKSAVSLQPASITYDKDQEIALTAVQEIEKGQINTFKEALVSLKDEEQQVLMTEKEIDRFNHDVQAIERNIDLVDKKRFFFFSKERIPCREKYTQYPVVKIDGPDSYDPNFTLAGPAGHMDTVHVINIKRKYELTEML